MPLREGCARSTQDRWLPESARISPNHCATVWLRPACTNRVERIEAFLRKRFGQSRKTATRVAEQLMSHVFHPRVIRALFGIDSISEEWLDGEVVDPAFDPAPIRGVIAEIGAHPVTR